MASDNQQVGCIKVEVGRVAPSLNPTYVTHQYPSPSPSPTGTSGPALVLSNSGNRINQAGKKKYVKKVSGRNNDSELHLAAQRGDLAAVRQILSEIGTQIEGTLSGEECYAEVAAVRASVVNDHNQSEETALFIAAEKGHIDVVKELLQYCNDDTLKKKNKCGFDPLHIAVSNGHLAIVQLLLDHEPGLSKTVQTSNATPLITAATKGHTDVVNELLSRDGSLVYACKSNGKYALHFAARQGHVEIVQILLDKEPSLARKTDKKSQTPLHLAVKGVNSEVVRLIIDADPAMVTSPDKLGNTALHVATRKKRVEAVNVLLNVPDINVNPVNREHKTPLDIAEEQSLSEESSEIRGALVRYGAVRANELHQPRDELRKTVSQIKNDVHMQLEQTKRTNKNVSGIAKELRKLHREGINNATNSVTVVAVLFATVAFAAIFTVPGGTNNNSGEGSGEAVVAGTPAFKIFFVFNALALFTSLAVVVVQITLVRGETKAEKRVVVIINKMMWLASVCTSVAFMASSYIVVGKHYPWAAIMVTCIGGGIMAAVLGTMTYYVVRSKRQKSMRRREKSIRRSGSNSLYHSEHSNSDVEADRFFAL